MPLERHHMNLSEQELARLKNKRISVDHVKLAYCAGYFDGEGCITMAVRENAIPSIAVASGDAESISVFSELFGGKVLELKPSKNGLRLFKWSKSGSAAVLTVGMMIPYLKAKRDQALLLWGTKIRFSTCGKLYRRAEGRISAQEKQDRLELAIELKRLKRVKYSA